jgi:hypothetical protein
VEQNVHQDVLPDHIYLIKLVCHAQKHVVHASHPLFAPHAKLTISYKTMCVLINVQLL